MKLQKYHIHIFLYNLKIPFIFKPEKAFPSAHIEEAQGTAEENRSYIRKEGKWEGTEKETTNLKETYEEEGIYSKQGRGNEMIWQAFII